MDQTLFDCDTLGGNRTPDALLRTEALYPLSYQGVLADETVTTNAPLPVQKRAFMKEIRSKGLEPPAYRSATYRSIH